jgi:hypothetical protein
MRHWGVQASLQNGMGEIDAQDCWTCPASLGLMNTHLVTNNAGNAAVHTHSCWRGVWGAFSFIRLKARFGLCVLTLVCFAG